MEAALPRRAVLTAILVLAATLAFSAPAQADGRHGAPSPGAAGIGDRLFPNLGNGGYDVLHYHLDLRYATSAPSQSIDGDVTIVARATQSLSRFNLDFAGASVGSVSVNHRSAAWTREGEELVITPKRSLSRHRVFVVQVEDFVAVPTVPDPSDFTTAAFFITPDGSATAPQPDNAHRIFPSNDHPRDKASYSFRIDTPSDVVAVTNGVRASKRTRGGRTTWLYVQRQPMASELIQLAVGKYDLTERGRHRGVIRRDVTSPSLTDFLEDKITLANGHLDYMTGLVGRYPFDAYGSLVVDTELGFALETQTISIYDRVWFVDLTQGVWEPTMVHKLAHEWFGNSVSPWEWSDLWLNEGHASWYEFIFAEENGQLAEDTENWRPAAEDRQPDVRAARARVGAPLRGRVGQHIRLHPARLAGGAARSAPVPGGLGLRDGDAADARPPGLDGQPGRGGRAGAASTRTGRAAYSVRTVSSWE